MTEKKSVNGKRKGNQYERVIANKLSDRFIGYTGIPNSFRRNADSGSFFGGKNKERISNYSMDKASFGDIVCPNNFNFTIECKNYKEAPSFSSIIKGSVNLFDKWIDQAEQDALSASKDFIIAMKFNNVPDFILVKNVYIEKFKQISPKMLYKSYVIYTLSDVLSLDDSIFFKEQ